MILEGLKDKSLDNIIKIEKGKLNGIILNFEGKRYVREDKIEEL